MKLAYEARLRKQLEARKRALLLKRRAAAARRRAAMRAKAKRVKLRCGGRSRNSRRRCIAMGRRYNYNKFCRKGRRGAVCRIVRSCKRGQSKDRGERMKCRRIYRRWRVTWMRYMEKRRRIRRRYN